MFLKEGERERKRERERVREGEREREQNIMNKMHMNMRSAHQRTRPLLSVKCSLTCFFLNKYFFTCYLTDGAV